MAMRILIKAKPEQLECHLTSDEFIDRANALGLCCQDIEREDDRQAQIKADMKAQLAKLEAERSRLTLVVTRKAEPRDVKVTLYADDNTGEAITIREDTGEIIRRRPLDSKERQLPLPMPGADGADGKGKTTAGDAPAPALDQEKKRVAARRDRNARKPKGR
jgi:hypothetical protein